MIPFPKKKYSIIYADPPWQHNTGQGLPYSKVLDHYDVMTLDDLIDLPVSEICSEDTLLFMWAISPELQQCLTLGKSWGFTYITIGFVWDKKHTVFGRYTHSQCEICLLFKKGKIPQPRGEFGIKQYVVTAQRSQHSSKPYEVRYRIDKMFPEHSKIELFARERFKGWDAWGNEISGSEIDIQKPTIDKQLSLFERI